MLRHHCNRLANHNGMSKGGAPGGAGRGGGEQRLSETDTCFVNPEELQSRIFILFLPNKPYLPKK